MRCWLIDSEYKSPLYDMQLGKAEIQDSSMTVLAESTVEPGDACVLWRSGAVGGVVAIGEVADVKTEQPVRMPFLESRQDAERPEPSRTWATATFTRLLLSAPVPPDVLQNAGLGEVVRAARRAGDRAQVRDEHWWSRPGRRAALLDLSEDELRRLAHVADEAHPPSGWPATWSIPPGTVVSRPRLHEVYGGNRHARAGHSGTTPNVFLFLRPGGDIMRVGREAWFTEGQEEGTLMVAGQGQWTNGVSRENLAVLAHLMRGVPLRVFLTSSGDCLYLGEFAIDQARPVDRWVTGQRPLFTKRPVLGTPRARDVRAPVFRLRQLSGMPLPADGTDPFPGAPRVTPALHVSDDHPAAAAVRRLLATLKDKPSVAAVLGDMDEAQVLMALMQRAQRQSDLDRLRAAVEDPDAKEGALSGLLTEMTWIFGGEQNAQRTLDITRTLP